MNPDNITATISDHLLRFLLLLMYFQKIHAKNPIFKKKIGQNLFNQTLYNFDKDWSDVLNDTNKM